MDKTFKGYNHSNRLMEQKTNHHVIERVKARRKQAPQSEANLCRQRRQMQSPKIPPLLIAQDSQ